MKEKDLLFFTNKFFKTFTNLNENTYPKWNNLHWRFNGQIPFNNSRGCYALFCKDEIIYIGVGIGKSFGIYSGHGLGDRLKRYYKKNKTDNHFNDYMPSANWLEITSILTLGFCEENYYIAAALEIYLIKQLSPIRNINHKP